MSIGTFWLDPCFLLFLVFVLVFESLELPGPSTEEHCSLNQYNSNTTLGTFCVGSTMTGRRLLASSLILQLFIFYGLEVEPQQQRGGEGIE